jgi:RNA polymerase sigma-70 factor (sigma-E family)
VDDLEFSAFVLEAGARLRNLALGTCGNSADADDLLQATFERLYRAWRKADPIDALSYARTALVRTHISERRRLRWKRERSGPVPEQAGDDQTPDRDSRLVLQSALNTLPSRQRQAVVLRYLEDLPLASVAEIMECSEGNVKRCAHDGLAALRSHLHVDRPEGAIR